MIRLTNGVNLTVTIDYQGQTTPDVVTVPVSKLVSATDPMPATPVPGNVVGTFQVTDDGQDGTGQTYEQGFVHLVVTAPSGVAFDSSTFGQVVWGLSDAVGIAWDSTNATLGHNHIYATLRANSTNVVDLYFPPDGNDAPPSGSTCAHDASARQSAEPQSGLCHRVRGRGLEPGLDDHTPELPSLLPPRRRPRPSSAPISCRRAPNTTPSTCPRIRRS